MKKVLWRAGAAFLLFVLLTGCGSGSNQDSTNDTNPGQTERNQTAEQNEETVRITITKDHGEEYIHEKEIPIEQGAILLDVLKENFYVETDDSGEFITSIERVSSEDDKQRAWIYTVNGEAANVGATDYELQAGDEVVFDFQEWE